MAAARAASRFRAAGCARAISKPAVRWLGLDVGGANVKAYAAASNSAFSQPFALWKDPAALVGALAPLAADHAPTNVALTMTGELCDCFPDKATGVRHIVDAAGRAFAAAEIRVWTTAGRFASPAEIRAEPLPAAASNFLALAQLVADEWPDATGLLFDIGSTTTDIIPFAGGRTLAAGRTDFDRLRFGELVYQGVERTPLCAISRPPLVANEFFATSRDAYVHLGILPEDAADRNTADGQPSTSEGANRRLARMACADVDQLPAGFLRRLALCAVVRQRRLIARALRRVAARLPTPCGVIVASGAGEFLVRMAVRKVAALRDVPIKSFAAWLGPEISTAACAYAVARLAARDSSNTALA